MPRRPLSASLRAAVSVTLGLALLLGLGVLAARLWVEWSWFEQFAKGPVLLRRWLLQVGLMGLGLGLGLGLQGWLSRFWRSGSADPGERRFGLAPAGYAAALGLLALAQLVPLALLLRLAQRLVLTPFDPRRLHGLTLLNGLPFSLLLLLAGLLAALLVWPRRAPRLVAALASLATATALGRAWGVWSLALLAPDSGVQEPMLSADISFGLVRFPALALGLTLLLALGTCHLAAGLWALLARPPPAKRWPFPRFHPSPIGAVAQAARLVGPAGSQQFLAWPPPAAAQHRRQRARCRLARCPSGVAPSHPGCIGDPAHGCCPADAAATPGHSGTGTGDCLIVAAAGALA